MELMKIVVAIIKPFSSTSPRRAYRDWGAPYDVTEVKGYGRQKGHTEIYRARICRELPAEAEGRGCGCADQADKAIEAITAAAKTGQIGDGKSCLGLEQRSASARRNRRRGAVSEQD